MMSGLNLDIFTVWGERERSVFVEFCQDVLLEYQTKSLLFGDKNSGLNFLLYEICHRCMQGEIPPETVVSALSEIISLHTELPTLIADILVCLDTESQNSESHVFRDRYFNLLRFCNNKIVPEFILKERLDFETLGDAGIIKLLKNTLTKFIKTKTRLFYKQHKFNLYREEMEGYAKLITECDPDSEGQDVRYVLEVIQSLIGCFNLDPNRVLDVVLESFEHRRNSEFFSELLLSYFGTSETISQVVGFKFSFYLQGDAKETPSSLYQVTAFLLKYGVISLNQLYGLLRPDDGKIIEEHKQEMTNAQLYVKQLNSLSTSPTENNKESNKNEDCKIAIEDNQKLGLCAALLDVGDWKHARQLINCFPDYYATSHNHIAKKLCTLVHVIIDDFYKKLRLFPEIKTSSKWTLESGVTCKGIESFSELFSEVFPMVLALGPHLLIDPILMAKIIRLSKYWMALKSNIPDYGKEAISNVIEQSLLPSLSLLECNCCMAEELWSLLKLFPYQVRYSFYYMWKSTINGIHPLLMKVKAETLKKLKYIMKRLSKENVKPSGRQIGKLSHSNPGYIFDYILSQIQTWDNLIVPVIDSLKYLTSLSYDVLAFCIIEALGSSEKDRMKHDGTSISVWFQSLASFAGSVFKKYPIDISGLLQHVANQLIAGKSLDLLILKEVVQKMAGIEASDELTNEQLEAMTGGELLRSEGGYFNQLRNVKKSSQRLKEALLDQDLAIPLCLLMAQQRQCILFQEQENSHIKLVGKLYDQCQDTLVQYGSFLANSLSTEDYIKRLPAVSALLSDYNIQADVAFYLSRPSLNHTINSKFEEVRKQDKTMKNLTSSESIQKYIEIVDSVFTPIVASIRSNQLLRKTWEDLNPQIYVTFWSLSMYDLLVPTGSYQREVNKLKAILHNEENKDAGKKKKERERCESLISKLMEEEKNQQDHCLRVIARLKNEKEDWFQTKAAKNETITQFLQLCLFPRCTTTPVDALYCAKFVNVIHNLKTPNFSTLLCYDRVFVDITNAVASCTENEANRYGLLLCSMLETVSRWHSDKVIFDKECAFFPGFCTKFKVATKTSDSAIDHVDYENYRHVCHKWHFKITKSLLKCLDSGDFVQIRNSLLVLRKIAPYFPVMVSLSSALERRMEKIKTEEKEKRPDIFVLATAYSGILKARKPFLVPESEYHLKESNRVNVNAVKNENAARSSEKKEVESMSIDVSKERNSKLEAKNDSSRMKCSSVDKSNAVQSNALPSNKKNLRNEENGVEGSRTKSVRPKEEKNVSESSSPMRVVKVETEKVVNAYVAKDEKRERRDDRYEKSGLSANEREGSESNRESHSYRRSLDVAERVEIEREHKRRRTEGSSSRSPREPVERDVRILEKTKDDERNGREKSVTDSKNYKSNSNPEMEWLKSDSVPEKVKTKEKKASRKREYPEENSSENRRRRVKPDKEDEDSVKRIVEGERETKSRREEKSPVTYASNSERRAERDDKKHHRSTSASSVKKRS